MQYARVPLNVSALACIGALALLCRMGGAVEVSKDIPEYKVVSGVSGSLSSVGSDSLNNLMALWAEKLKSYYPNLKIQIEGKGSSTAPPALIEGLAQLGPMSRAMKGQELDGFEKKYGYKPTCIKVAVDALAVFVNKDNPLKSISFPQIDAIFSKTRKGGHPEDIAKWGQLGLTGDWAERPISLYGRNSASGTYGYFKEEALFKGDYRDTVKEQPGSAAVVQGVTEDRFAMGYSGIGYATVGVRALPVAEKAGAEAQDASPENAYAGKYPLARFLIIYVNKAPGKPVDLLTREFLKLVLSKQGQEVVLKGGYFPLTTELFNQQLSQLGEQEVASGKE